jgi:branched-chain amino acid transport system substrate-binding protein
MTAAQMAIDDLCGSALDRKIELLAADHQRKPDVALPLVRQRFAADSVHAIVEKPCRQSETIHCVSSNGCTVIR